MSDLNFYPCDDADEDQVAGWHHAALVGDRLALGTLTMLAFEAVSLRRDLAEATKSIPKRKNRNPLMLVYCARIARAQIAKKGRIDWRAMAAEASNLMCLEGFEITDRAVRGFLGNPQKRDLIEFLSGK